METSHGASGVPDVPGVPRTGRGVTTGGRSRVGVSKMVDIDGRVSVDERTGFELWGLKTNRLSFPSLPFPFLPFYL